MSGLPARLAARRSVLKGAALAGATALGAAACGPGAKAASPVPTAPVDLGSPHDVPVGGARLYREDKVVVYRPAQGSYRGFSAVCTHQGCVLTELVKTTGECSCHGSRFDVTTGKVLQGPATSPLPAVPVRAEGGRLVAGPDASPGTSANPSGGAAGASAGASSQQAPHA